MKIKCIRNMINEYERQSHQPKSLIGNRIIQSEIDQEHYVLGILYHENKLFYLVLNEYYYMVESSYFTITDHLVPRDWIVQKYYQEGDSVIVSFPEIENNFYCELVDGNWDKRAILQKRYDEMIIWYRDMEIDAFFTKSDQYNINEIEKKTMIEYYKSLPDFTQWEQDKELLALNRKEE